MSFILKNFEVVATYVPFAFGACLLLILMFFAVNSRSVYASLNKRTAKCARRLKKPAKRKGVVGEAYPVPQEYYEQFESYKKSVGRFPSEFLKFSSKKQRLPFFVLNIIILTVLLAFAGLCVFRNENLLLILTPVGLSVLFVMLAIAVKYIRKGNMAKAKKIFFNFCKLLDFYYGKDFFLYSDLQEAADNKKVDMIVSKIDFLTRGGIEGDIAKKLASLLNDEELKRPRTVEQQKKLNLALNRLVQRLSAQKTNAVA